MLASAWHCPGAPAQASDHSLASPGPSQHIPKLTAVLASKVYCTRNLTELVYTIMPGSGTRLLMSI